ncbi:hypothetical protein KY284_010695 [Solanum tuberosum]|nr:hypothetical protein KY284_010695 [Solanum tuberosum]
MVQGKEERFDPTRNNAYYALLDADNEVHKARSREAGHEWFVTHLHNGYRPVWIKKSNHIDSLESTSEGTIDMCHHRGIPINVGQVIIHHIHEVVLEGNVMNNRKINVQDPMFDTFDKSSTSPGSNPFPPPAELLWRRPPTLVH